MRFLVMHKVDANMEAGGPPSQQIIAGMGALVQESLKNRVFTSGAGLHRSARRARLESGGAKVTKGPYAGQNELVSSFAMIKASSLDEAIERARQFAKVLGDVEIEVGPVVEPWDIGVLEKPEKLPLGRFLLLCKGDRQTESGAELSPARRAALEKLLQSLRDEGVLVMSDRLAPSAKGARLASGQQGKRNWTDGPFAESKELIAGFSVLNVPSRPDALAWAERYAAILGDNEVDVRELAE
ncbi:MAG: YciI family protein [Deltaproteobacteria bacterium]